MIDGTPGLVKSDMKTAVNGCVLKFQFKTGHYTLLIYYVTIY